MFEDMINSVRELLDRYTSDEVGQDERAKFKKMDDYDMLLMLANTLQYEIELNREIDDIKDMFDTDLILDFNIFDI